MLCTKHTCVRHCVIAQGSMSVSSTQHLEAAIGSMMLVLTVVGIAAAPAAVNQQVCVLLHANVDLCIVCRSTSSFA